MVRLIGPTQWLSDQASVPLEDQERRFKGLAFGHFTG